MSAVRLAFVLVLGLSASPAAASKFTGPKHVEVYARVVADAEAASPAKDERFEWRRAPEATRWLEAQVLAVVSYDDNGWAVPTETYLPGTLWIGAVAGGVTRGDVVLVGLDYSAGYRGKLEISHTIITARLLPGPAFVPDPLVERIRKLPDAPDAHHAYRLETPEPSDAPERLRCSTGEHVVRRRTIEITRAGATFRTSAAELHELELHGRRLSKERAARLTSILGG